MECFYLITNRQKDKDLETTREIQEYLTQHGKKCFVNRDDTHTKASEIPEDVDCVIVLGGDGTLLQAARDTIEREIPLLGVNLGTLGYLAEVEKSNIKTALDNLICEEYEIEERMLLSGKAIQDGRIIEETYALNDIVIARGSALRIISFRIYVNGQMLNSYQADGVIVSTPTGSTGYNMSAGGPIVEPKAKLMVITPICPHTLNTRSIVLAAEDKVIVEIAEGRTSTIQEAEAGFDGSHRIKLSTNDRIEITQSEKKVKIVKMSKVSFLETLHKKMNE